MGILGQAVGFVEYDDFEVRTRVLLQVLFRHGMRVADLLSCKVLNLLSYNRNASFVACVQFKYARLVELWSVKLAQSA